MHGSERWRTQINDTLDTPRPYMIVYTLTRDDGTVYSGLYMDDEKTIQAFDTWINATTTAQDLVKFMSGCGYNCMTRIVKLVAC